MATLTPFSWNELFERRRAQIERACVGTVALTPADYDRFQQRIVTLTTIYARRGLAKWLAKIDATLNHVRSFNNALSVLAQASPESTLVWGSLLLVIECMCRFTSPVSALTDMIAKMNSMLPLFDRSLALYPESVQLQFPLRDLFNEYIDACILMMRHLQRSPFRNLLATLLSSSLTTSLDKSTERIETYGNLFLKEVDATHRETMRKQHLELVGNLGQQSASNASHFNVQASQGNTEVKFPVTTIVAIRNSSFVGRDDVLSQMKSFFHPQTALLAAGKLCCILHGLGGQGKSQTAREYAYKYAADYDATFWLDAGSEQELARSYANISKKLRLSARLPGEPSEDSLNMEQSRGVENARDWLEDTDRKWLLIFDNIEGSKNFGMYLPRNLKGRGSVIFTTQKPHMVPNSDDYHRIALQPLPTTSGAELLYKSLGRQPIDKEEESVAHEIAGWVGGLPLAIATIGGFIKQSSSTPAETLASLKRSSKIWVSTGGGTVRDYDKTLATVFDLALRELSSSSRHLIEIMAFLNPDHVPEDMLRQRHTVASLKFLHDDDEYIGMTYDLGLRQLIQREETTGGYNISIHRSLQMNVLHYLRKDWDIEKRQRTFEEAFTIIDSVLPQASRLQTSEPMIWPQYYRYVPQVLSLHRNSRWPDPPLSLRLPFARMLSNIGTFLWNTGQFQECAEAMKTAEEIIFSQDEASQETPESRDLLGDIYLVTGILADCIGVSRRRESMDHRKALLDIRLKAHDRIPADQVTIDDEIRLGNARTDLGCAHMQRGEYEKAEEIFEGMLISYKRWGAEHEYPFEYSKYFEFTSYVLMAASQPEKSIEHMKKGAELEELHSGGIDTNVLMSRYNYASILFYAGKVDQALDLHKSVLRDRRQLCGEGSQFTLESYEATATLMHLTGNNAEAKTYLENCLESRFRANWTIEGVARAQMWLSRILRAMGENDSADKEARSALLVRERFLQEYGEFLQEDPTDEMAVFDQMLPMWIMQTTGKLVKGGKAASTVSSP